LGSTTTTIPHVYTIPQWKQDDAKNQAQDAEHAGQDKKYEEKWQFK
jgi:hypothetical protein